MVYSDPISKATDPVPAIPERVIVSGNRTICLWPDGSKQVATCDKGDDQSAYVGILVAFARRYMPRLKDGDGRTLSFGETMDRLVEPLRGKEVRQVPRAMLDEIAWEAVRVLPPYEERTALEHLFSTLWAAVNVGNGFTVDYACENLRERVDAYVRSRKGPQ